MTRVTFADIGGMTTRYLHAGSGDHGVLLLHGVGVGADSWFWNLEALVGAGRCCVAPDLLGFGMTGEDASSDGASLHDAIVRHLVTLIDHLGLCRVTIVGSSFGSQIACLLYRRVADMVDRLVLVGCGPALNGPGTLAAMYEQSYANGIKAMSDPTLETCRRRMENLVHDSSTVPEALLLMQLTLYGLPETRARYERRMRGIMERESLDRHDVTAWLESITAPTLLIWGRHDTRGSLDEALGNSRRLSAGNMVIFEDCGHLPYLEQPEKFNAHVRAFLEGEAAASEQATRPASP